MGADDSRYVLMTLAVMAMFQACETLFTSLKMRMARLPAGASNASQVAWEQIITIENLCKSACKDFVRNSVRSVENYRDAWMARMQAASDGDPSLDLEIVLSYIRTNSSSYISKASRCLLVHWWDGHTPNNHGLICSCCPHHIQTITRLSTCDNLSRMWFLWGIGGRSVVLVSTEG